MKILLNGSKGRMGQAISEAAPNNAAVISEAIDEGDDLSKAIENCDVVIEFSFHSVTLSVVEIAAKHQKPVQCEGSRNFPIKIHAFRYQIDRRK